MGSSRARFISFADFSRIPQDSFSFAICVWTCLVYCSFRWSRAISSALLFAQLIGDVAPHFGFSAKAASSLSLSTV